MTDHTINENETDNIMGKKENENLEDLFAEVEQLIAHMEEDISLDESFVCYEPVSYTHLDVYKRQKLVWLQDHVQ